VYDRVAPAPTAESTSRSRARHGLRIGGVDAHVSLTLYRAATLDRPVSGMFSFVPARRADDPAPRFPRPAIGIPGLINPANRQSTWGSKRPLDIGAVRTAWCAVKEQVVEAGLLVAVSLEAPPREGTAEPVRATERSRC
jgi:hypothetical protein